MNKILKIIIIAIIAISSGCTKDAEIPLPAYQPTLVIHSYISPRDSGVMVFVHMSSQANSFGNNSFVYNATVKISDGINTTNLLFQKNVSISKNIQFYFVDSNSFKIKEGKTYSLTVSTPDGKLATATTTVPTVVPIKTISYKSLASQFGDSVYKLTFTFLDPPNKDDYYQFCAYVLDIDTTIDDIQNHYSIENLGNYFSSDGKIVTENLEVPSYSFLEPEQIRKIDYRLLHVTREYYLYHQSIETAFNSGGPFSEPAVAFTNITGGVGVFAAFNSDQLMIRP